MSQEPSDADLVATYRRTGAPSDFEPLVHRHRAAILRLVLSVLGTDLQADAEDVVQLAFLRAHDRLGTFRGASRFGTWLHRIAYNLALDHKRRRRRRARLLREGAPGAEAATEVSDPAFLDEGDARSVREALLEIPDPYQTALRLRYWFDLEVAEIAAALGVPVGTAKSYLHRGRQRLHRRLQAKELRP